LLENASQQSCQRCAIHPAMPLAKLPVPGQAGLFQERLLATFVGAEPYGQRDLAGLIDIDNEGGCISAGLLAAIGWV
jgi:hypothetical protein